MGFLILAILCCVMVSVIMRVSGRYIHNNMSMLMVNYLACAVLSWMFMNGADGNLQAAGLGTCVLLGVISGVLYLATFVLLQWNQVKNGVVLSALFMKLGVTVPVMLSMACFGEMPGVFQGIGLAAALSAILMINMQKGKEKAASGAGLVALLLCGGGADAMTKVYEVFGRAELKDVYLLLTFASAMLCAAALCAVKKQGMRAADVLFGVLIAVPNYFSARYLLLSLDHVSAVVAYPVYSVTALVSLSLIGVVAFGERLGRRQKIGMGIILLALVLLNL